MAFVWLVTRGPDILIGDFNADGHDDIIGRAVGLNSWWMIDGQTGNSVPFGSGASVALSHMSAGDFNGYGRTDIAGRAASGTWWVFESTGTSFSLVAGSYWVSNDG